MMSSSGELLGNFARAADHQSIYTAPLALRAAKQAISRAPELALESGLDFERASYETLLKTQDRLEALQAFKEKRTPVFKGE